MLNFDEKILYIEELLINSNENYADSYSADIYIFFDEFNSNNEKFDFLKELKTPIEIDNWFRILTSRLIMKEDEEDFVVNEIICDYMELG